MPRGVYPRKGRRKASAVKRSKTKAVKAKPVAAPREIATLSPNAVIDAFSGHAKGWHRQSLTLACSAAVCLIVGAHAKGKAIEQNEMIEKLREAVAGRAKLADSQVSKYIGLAKLLVNHVMTRFKLGGPVHDIIRAGTAEGAIDVLAAYLDKQRVTTLEGLTVMFGKYRRTATKPATGRRTSPAAHPPGNGGNGGGQRATPGEEGRPVRIGGVEIEGAAAGQGLSVMMKSLPTEFLVLSAVQAGHSAADIAVAAINLTITDGELGHIDEMLTARNTTLQHIGQHSPTVVPLSKRAVA